MVDGTTVVELHEVTVRYGRRTVLDRVSLAVAAGERVALRGVNGSGKTTVLRVLANVARPGAGRRTGPPSSAYVPAALTPPVLSARRWLHGVPRRTPTDREAALERLAFDGDLDRDCRALSFGNLRKLVLAEALSSGESLVVVDEASAGLDEPGVGGLYQLIAEVAGSGTAVVVADQDSRPIPVVGRVLRLRRGALLTGSGGDELAELSFAGPVARGEELVALAARLGFRRLTDDPAASSDGHGDR